MSCPWMMATTLWMISRTTRHWPKDNGFLHWTFRHNNNNVGSTNRHASSTRFSELAVRPSSKCQIYISQSLDPYRNLSIEHFLLQKTPPDSTILFLYVNRPCVVIGRNQNPWVEANLRLLNISDSKGHQKNGRAFAEPISLVRRRSGGGTVFHDQGNVNYCVICPTAKFNRDKHAVMVATALNNLGVDEAKVNERHDIVLDPGTDGGDTTDDSNKAQVGNPGIRKISGSAYKLTKNRALHHGTCLLQSPNLDLIPLVLHSPAKPYIKARGAESVRSPVGNVNVSPEAFKQAVLREFGDLYGIETHEVANQLGETRLHDGHNWVWGILEDAQTSIPEVQEGMKELMSPEWIYLQTPQFEFSNHVGGDEKSEIRTQLPHNVPKSARISLTVRSGKITSGTVSISSGQADADREASALKNVLEGRSFHEITDWNTLFIESGAFRDAKESRALGSWLNSILTHKSIQS